MHYSLNKKRTLQLIDKISSGVVIEDNELTAMIDAAVDWQAEISVFSYLFAQILLKKKETAIDCSSLLDKYFKLPEEMYFCIQEFNFAFINYMLHHLRNPSLDLEDELLHLQNNLKDNLYGQTLRY